MKRAVGVLVAVLVLGGDEEDEPGARPQPDRSPVTVTPSGTAAVAPAEELQAYYTQEVTWSPCASRPQFDCATMEVPLDYAEPDGERIDIALLKVPAREPERRVGSLVVNPGGPGGSGTDYAASASLSFRQALLQRFDIVGFDPRGTGDSTTVDCLTDAELDAYVAADQDPDTPAEMRSYDRLLRLLGQGCVERSGALASHVTTIEAARDMDVLRSVLGEDRLAYFGASYGTKLGATYAELFPKRVGRFVLDGAVDISLSSRQVSLEQAAGFETAIRAYVADCVDTAGCFLGASVEEGLDRIRRFVASVDAAPLPVGDRELAVGNAFYGIVVALYDRSYWVLLTTALSAAFDGDGSQLLRLSDAYHSRNPDGTYADNSSEAFVAISCLDDPWSVPVARVPEEEQAFVEAAPTFGRVWAYGLAGCSGVTARSTVGRLSIDASGAAPMLVIGTSRDPATPYRWAVALAAQLEPAILVSRDGDGHTGYNAGNSCVDDTVESFLLAGEVPAGPVDCPAG